LTALSPDDLDQDFGYIGAGSIGETVWLDTNGDGVQNAGEPGVPGVDIIVTYLGPDGIAGSDDDLTFATTTDADGNYGLAGLPYGDYIVSIDTSTLPEGIAETFDADGGLDSTSTTTLTSASPVDANQRFGFNGNGSIGDTVWTDTDGDGVHDPDEPGIAGVDLSITYLGTDGAAGGGDDIVFRVTTDDNGRYGLPNLPLGDYAVAVDGASLPDGVVATHDADGSLDSIAITTLTTAAPANPDLDFGYRAPTSGGPLAFTGSSTDVQAAVAALLLLIGLALALGSAGRKNRRVATR